MIKNYLCSKCHNIFSQKDYPLHIKYCQGLNNPITTTTTQAKSPIITTNQNYTTQHIPYTTNITYSNNPNQNINHYTTNTTYTKNPIQNINNYTTNTTYSNNLNPNMNTYTTTPTIQTYIPKTTTTTTQTYRPKTAIYTTPYTNIQTNNIPQNSNYDTNYNYGVNMKQSFYTCNVCGEKIPFNNKNDHMLCHKIEQEDKDLLQAKKIQDEDIFGNASPEEVEQQLKIEQYIQQEQQQRRNNNNNFNNNNNIPFPSNNNFMTNDFNFDSDFGNLNGMGNFTTMDNMNNNNPNVIIRRFVSNGNSPNFGNNMGNPDFFSNFFNQGFGNNNPSGMRMIRIPMGFMGNEGGQNDLNEMIERMLHYSRENPTDAAIVSELPETKIDDIKKLDKDKQNCVICMEDFKNGDKSTNLPCLHMFHTNCIQSWLKTQNTCPICKFKLTQDNINNINRRGQ